MTSDRPRMTPQRPHVAEDDGRLQPWQFSLAALMGLTTIVSITLALAVVHVGLLVPWLVIVLIGGGIGCVVAGNLRGWVLGMVYGYCGAILLMVLFGGLCFALVWLFDVKERDLYLDFGLLLIGLLFSGVCGLALGGWIGGILARCASKPVDADEDGEFADRESPPDPQ